MKISFGCLDTLFHVLLLLHGCTFIHWWKHMHMLCCSQWGPYRIHRSSCVTRLQRSIITVHLQPTRRTWALLHRFLFHVSFSSFMWGRSRPHFAVEVFNKTQNVKRHVSLWRALAPTLTHTTTEDATDFAIDEVAFALPGLPTSIIFRVKLLHRALWTYK